MIAKFKKKNIKNKLYTVIITFAALFVVVGISIVGITAFGGNTLTKPVPTQVTLNGVTYTKDSGSQFVILEIVPQEGLGELGYMVGGDSMPIKPSDISKISNAENRAKVTDAWKDCVGCITGIWDRTKYSNDGLTIEGFEDRNLFANSVFGNSNMTDKILVKSVGAKSVTKTMVDEADLIYVNPGYHSSKFYEAYNLMAQYAPSSGLSKVYTNTNTNSNRALFSNYNFSAEIALAIYIKSVKDNMPLIYDDAQTKWGNTESGDNYSKLGQLLLDIDPDAFITEFASQKNSDTSYSGTKGSIKVNNSILQITRNSTNVNWDSNMFVENNTPQYPYFNGGTRNSLYLRKNVLAYSGYNLMDMLFLGGGSQNTDYNGIGTYLGTDFDVARNIFGINSNGNLAYTSMVRYIIGDFPSPGAFHKISVLEIQPSSAYQYNNYDGAVRIANYFGLDSSVLNANNWNSYIEVKSVASNGFNGMNEDIIEKYDLVIVGSNNPSAYLKTSTIYSSKGEQMLIKGVNTSTRFSGNDMTQKSVNKIVAFAKAGKPMILSQDLFYGNGKIDSTASIYNLSIVRLRAQLITAKVSDRNIMDEPARPGETIPGSYRYLIRMEKPTITIDQSLKVNYNNDIATTTVSAGDLSNLRFFGKIGDSAKNYNLVVYIDKNSNGLFAPEASDDTNEVFYKGNVATNGSGDFSINLDLPETLRGYIGWKVVATDTATGLSSEDLGGFVIEVRTEDVKTVKLLQIIPIPTSNAPITLNMKTNQTFQQLFANTQSVSGLKLDVSTMTTREYEDMYKNGNTYTKGDYNTHNMLKNYSMVVFGFSDAFSYNDISNANGALDNLYDYIEKGNSVLFVHDLTSFSAYSDGSKTVDYGNSIGGTTWGFNITKTFRNIIGMDRYGASLNLGYGDSIQGYTNEFLFRFGKTSYSIFNGVTAYNNNILTDKVDRLNQGQVTEFPYKTAENLSISPTHAQYFQLNLEGHDDINEDVVVWYTLGDSNNYSASKYYSYAGQDAVNSYYIYSKGNVTYTGSGHSQVSSEEELKLFVNTVIRAILSGNSVPEVTVKNAAIVTDGQYELFSRKDDQLPNIDFVALDRDLSTNTGKFQSGLIYWDMDGDGNYNTGDIVIKQYGLNELPNAHMVTIELNNYQNIKNSKGVTLLDFYKDRSNFLKVGIQATDGYNSTGSASVTIRFRNLFNLD